MTDLAELVERVTELEHERDHFRELYLEVMERCKKLELGLVRSKSERLFGDDSQMSFSMLEMMLGERASAEIEASVRELEAEQQKVVAHTRQRPTGRHPIPEHLPRVDIEVLPPEVEREGLNAFERIGQEVSEVLERRPASLVIARVIRPKFVRKGRAESAETSVLIAEVPELPIPKGLGGPGLVADTIVRRWQDHLPLHRLEEIYARDGVELARSTVCGWHLELASLAKPLVDAMRLDAFEQPYLCTDATGVLVQHPKKCRTGHFWVMVAPERHVLFEYTREHSGDAVDDVLAGYKGYLVADAHIVYDHLYKDGSIVEVNCWAHARRYFFKALDSDPERARVALGLIAALFRIERTLKNSPRKKKEVIRKKRSAPVLERFFSWCDAEIDHVLEGTPVYDGIRYARNQRKGLERFLDDGRLPIDNNISERNLRRQAVGRKNWIFLGSDEGGATNAIFTSLLASCRMHEIEPWAYMRDLLCLLPSWSAHRVLELAPLHWEQTRKRDDVRALLDNNPYRRITLLDPTP